MLTRAKANKKAPSATAVSLSSSRVSSATVQAQRLAAEAEHLKRVEELENAKRELDLAAQKAELENAKRELDLAAQKAVAEAEHRALLASLDAAESRSRRSSRASARSSRVSKWLDASILQECNKDFSNEVPVTTARMSSQADAEDVAAVTPPDNVPFSGFPVVNTAFGKSVPMVALPSASTFPAGRPRDTGPSLPLGGHPATKVVIASPPQHQDPLLHSTLGTQNLNYCNINKNNENHTPQLAQAISALAAAITSRNRVSFPLPIFDGRPSDWLIFRKIFNDTSSTFTPAENLVRLNAALRGAARDSVAILLAVARDPEDVMLALETAFARPEHIVLAQISIMRALPKLTASENCRELNAFSCSVRNCVEIVRLLQRPEYLASPELSNEIVSKFTPLLRSRWIDFAYSREHTNLFRIELLSEFLIREANLRSKYDVMPFDVSVKNVKCHTTVTPVSATETTNKQKGFNDRSDNKVCFFCANEGHDVKSCKEFANLDVNQRWTWVKDNKVCHKCLLKGGHTYLSCKKFLCKVKDCEHKFKHHSLLHQANNAIATYAGLTSEQQTVSLSSSEVTNNIDDENDDLSSSDASKSEIVAHSTSTPSSLRTLLKVVAVTITGPKGSYDTFALLDDGSTASIIDSKVASAIGVEGRKGHLKIDGIGGMSKQTEVNFVDIKVKGRHSSETHSLQNVRAIPNLGLASQYIKLRDIQSASYLSDIVEYLTYDQAKPMLLIGIDNWQLSVPNCIRKGSRNQPVAALTALGWVIFGSIKSECSPVEFVNHCVDSENTNSLDVQLKEYFHIDSIGINTRNYLREDDKVAIDILEKTTHRLPSGRFETGLLWRSNIPIVPNSYPLARSRFLTLEKKMCKDKSYADAYSSNIKAMIQKGYAEPCDKDTEATITWYLPHFSVVHPQKKKLRVVHDAAATCSGVSLNSLLLSGPDILQPLLAILMRFREGCIALNADIREMFPQTKIRSEDRDAQRFLWRDDQTQPLKIYRMSSMMFGATSSPFTALYLKNRNAEEHRDRYPAAADAIVRDHYMDDYLGSLDSPEGAAQLVSDIVHVHAQAGLDMRAWVSNSKKALSLLPADICTPDATAVNVRILGVAWNVTDDSLCFSRSNLSALPEKFTKRAVLSQLMKVYDPLGFLTPIIIKGRIIFQQTWKLGIDWDEELPPPIICKWKSWFTELSKLLSGSIPRHYFSHSVIVDCQLHVFADASELSYACVAYWRFKCVDGSVQLALIGGKARLAPLKPVSIPRLELQAGLIAARFASYILEAHRCKPTKVFYWSDSLTVLKWLRSDARSFKSFVSHRVGEIAELSNISNWRYVPSGLNVADDATRVDHNFHIKSRWFSGPNFLTLPAFQWPVEPTNVVTTPEEMKRSAPILEAVGLTNVSESFLPVVANITRFSQWLRLLRATARVLCCARAFRLLLCSNVGLNSRVSRESEQTAPSFKPLLVEDLARAERNLFLQSQIDSFEIERACLLTDKPLPKQSRFHNLTLCLDHFGLLRLSGRIGAVEGTDVSKNPVVLDGKHYIVKLLIKHHHQKAAHTNNELVVNELRQSFYVLGLRPAVKNVAKSCLTCRIRKTVPLIPAIGDLPPERLAHHTRPFSYVGLDYFGPVTVTIGRRTEKRWVALFTCLTVRAIHLEIVGNLTSDSAIMALRRFIARRGCPSTLLSDNGTAFIGANKELSALYTQPVQEYVLNQRINWKFNPPAAPFMGGCWERMVRSVKNALKNTLKERAPREEVLHTLLLEVEGILNSRPLTHVSVDPDAEEAITPFHFILGSSSPHSPLAECTDADLIRRVQWKKAQRLADHFWARWVREYLPSLVPRPESRPAKNLKPGDLVLIVDGNLPRGSWPRGRVSRIFPGHDGVVRVAEVALKNGFLRRPTRKLVPLPM